MTDKHDDKLIGKIIFKHFKIVKKIGEGSFGEIYIAVHTETKEQFAVKFVR